MKSWIWIILCAGLTNFSLNAGAAAEIKVGDKAPLFKAQMQDGKSFDLAERKDKWTILYFYPKAGTPGCTKQACAFRDSIKKIHELNADVFGISGDDVAALASFHAEHKLSFSLLADPKAEIIENYGAKIPMMRMSKRWTFLIGPDLTIRSIDRDVDPLMDAQKMANKIRELSGAAAPAPKK